MLADEAEHFDCETCEIAQAQRQLDAENADAWRLFHLCGSRVAVQWQLSGLILSRVGEHWSVDELTDMVERFDIIAAELAPPKAEAD